MMSLTFFAYIFFVAQSRILILASMLSVFYYYYSFYPIKKSFMKMIPFISYTILLFIIIQAINPEYFRNISFLISDTIFSINNNSSTDLSYGIRIFGILTVYSFFLSSPISFYLGVGSISTQFEGGFNNIFGYLYPADLGIIGGIFLYGIFNVFILTGIQIYQSFNAIKKISSTDDIFIISMKYMLIFYIFYLPISGLYIRSSTLINIDMWAIVFFTILAYNKQKDHHEFT